MPSLTTSISILAAFALILLTTALLRILYILPSPSLLTRYLPLRSQSKPHNQQTTSPNPEPPPPSQTHLLIVLGSGGHTAEMLSMLSHPAFDPDRYTHRTYLISAGDAFSAAKAIEFESRFLPPPTQPSQHQQANPSSSTPTFQIHTIPRARQIHQPLLTTPFTSLHCLWHTTQLLHTLTGSTRGPGPGPGPPDLILTNGPGTGLIVVLAGLLLRAFAPSSTSTSTSSSSSSSSPSSSSTSSTSSPSPSPKRQQSTQRTKSIYIESWARARRPSLTGRLVVRAGLCDRVLVQWPRLAADGWGEYRGVLVR